MNSISDIQKLETPVEAIQGKSLQRSRFSISCLFFLQGICFASWASRIPEIQTKLSLSMSGLGLMLLSIPTGLLISLPFTAWLVSRLGSRKVAALGLGLYLLALVSIGFSGSRYLLAIFLFLFGFAGNMSNIAINTQAVALQKSYARPIMASFHGVWSLSCFAGALIGGFAILHHIPTSEHFIIIATFILVTIVTVYKNTIKEEGSETSDKIFAWPEKALIALGLIACASMMCEGAMFDWSGIYFTRVIRTVGNWQTSGYMAFTATMATGRFFADWFTHQFGIKRILQVSGCLIATGFLLAVTFPVLIAGLGGFLLVGLGVSSVVPLVYSAAGKSGINNASMAITSVSTIGFFGFLIGPPMIGFIAGLTSLRISFLIIAMIGLSICFLAKSIKS